MKARRLTVVPNDAAAQQQLLTRAQRLRTQSAVEKSADVVEVAELTAGDARFVIPLRHLQGAMPLRSVCPVPLAPPHIVGVLRFGGRIVPAFSFAALVKASGWRHDPAVLLVIDVSSSRGGGGAEWVAFDAEEIPRVRSLPKTSLERALAASPGPFYPLVHEGARLTLIDPRQLVASLEAGR